MSNLEIKPDDQENVVDLVINVEEETAGETVASLWAAT